MHRTHGIRAMSAGALGRVRVRGTDPQGDGHERNRPDLAGQPNGRQRRECATQRRHQNDTLAPRSSACQTRGEISCSMSAGLVRYLAAPSLMSSTAMAMLPYPVNATMISWAGPEPCARVLAGISNETYRDRAALEAQHTRPKSAVSSNSLNGSFFCRNPSRKGPELGRRAQSILCNPAGFTEASRC